MPPRKPAWCAPLIVTWADADHVAEFRNDIAALRPQVDIVVASCHWGPGARAAGVHERDRACRDRSRRGPRYRPWTPRPAAVEMLSGPADLLWPWQPRRSETGHGGRKHENWLGMLVELVFDHGPVARTCDLRLVRHNDANETFFCRLEPTRRRR